MSANSTLAHVSPFIITAPDWTSELNNWKIVHIKHVQQIQFVEFSEIQVN